MALSSPESKIDRCIGLTRATSVKEWYLCRILFYWLTLYKYSDGSNIFCLDRSWWRHPMKTFSALLAICAGHWPVNGEFPTQRPMTRSFDVFFDLRQNKRLSKQSWGWWFETPSRHYDVIVMSKKFKISKYHNISYETRFCGKDKVIDENLSEDPDSINFWTYMMTSWNGNIFRDTGPLCVTGHLCGEFTGHRWNPHTKASDADLRCFLWSAPE